ncbi:MAG: DHH family phosphoesterase [Lachnospiraceae bacterium]|nr:DHH family phosphoesterase [Lachnospiraceae bacterium]
MSDNRIQGKLRQSLHWPLYLLPLMIVLIVLMTWINPYAGLIAGVITGCYGAFLVWWMLSWRRQVEGELIEFGTEFVTNQYERLMSLPRPYCIIGNKGEVLWVNREFEALLPEEEDSFSIEQMCPGLCKKLPEAGIKRTEHIKWRDRAYQFDIQLISERTGMYSIFLFDETLHLNTLAELEAQRAVIGQVYIDNYEEVMGSTEQVRQSLLAALIERKLSRYFGQFDAQIRKVEKDKYSVFMQKKGLDAAMEDHFSILEDVKTLNIGNTTAVTLSISMATGRGTLDKNDETAQNAMNLALGRGGDQAVVRMPEKTIFYGGKKEREEGRATRVKARVKAQALRELMTGKEQVLIMGHQMPDMDCFGAAIGIYRAAVHMQKSAHIVMNEITSSLRPIIDRFVDNPDYPQDLIINSEKAKSLLAPGTMVVVVDVNRQSYTECPSLVEKAETIVVLDHHRQNSETIKKSTLSYIEPYASSASEMVAEVLQYFSDSMRIKPLEAETIYAGIVMDTDNFLAKTGVRTFEAAAFLRRHGADVTRVRKLFRERMQDTRVKTATVSNAEMFMDNYAIGVCRPDGVESPTVIGAQAANDMLDIIGVRASFVFTPYNGKVYISARSIDEVNVQLIMERLGGGGHLSIAGAQLTDCTVEEAKERVKDTILQMTQEGAL